MRYRYCPQCGTELGEIRAGDDGMVPWCPKCDKRWFDTFQDCVIVLTHDELDEIVLARQGRLSDRYASVTSGYITPGETAEQAAAREVREELGLEVERLAYAGTYWYGRGDMLMHGFVAFSPKRELVLSGELDSAEWVPALEAPKVMFPDGSGGALYGVYHEFLRMRGLERP